MSTENKTADQPISEIDQLRRMNDDLQAQVASCKKLIEQLNADIPESKQAEAKNERALAETSALLEGLRGVLDHPKYEDCARVIFDCCKRLTGATAGYVALLSADGSENEVLFLDAGGHHCTVDPDLPMPIRGFREQAYAKGKTVYNNDFAESKWWGILPKGHVRLENVLFSPLVIDKKTVGLIGLGNKPGGFDDEDARLATAFGEYASIALHRKHTEEKLRKASTYIDAMGTTLIVMDMERKVIELNAAAMDLLGYSQEDICGLTFEKLFPESEHDKHYAAMKETLEDGKVGSFETSVLTKNGNEVPVLISSSVLKDSEYKPIGFVGVLRDITERKEAEKTLHKSEESLRLSIENMLEGYAFHEAIFDENGRMVDYRFLEFNPAAQKISGITKEELVGRTAMELYPHIVERGLMDRYADVMATGKPDYIEDFYYAGDSLDKAFDITCYRIDDCHFVCIFRDITERKKAEERLRDSEARFRATFDQAAVGVAHVAPDGKFVKINQKFCDIVGYTHEEMLERTFQDITHPDDLNADLDYARQVLDGDISTYSMEKRYFHKDNSVIWVNLTVSLLRDDSGTPDFFISVIEDITERKRVEEALLENEERFRLMMQQSPSVIELYDMDGLQIKVNRAYEDLWGFPASNTVNKFNVLESKEVEDTGLMEYVKRAYAGETVKLPEYEFDSTGETEGKGLGRTRWLSTRIYPLKDNAGKVKNIVITHENITERKQAEEALRKSERRFWTLVESAPIAVYETDAQGKCLYVNEQWRKLTGLTLEEALGDGWQKGLHKEDRARIFEQWNEHAQQQEPWDMEYRFSTPEGKVSWMVGMATAMRDADGQVTGYIGTNVDVTERKKAEEALQESEERFRWAVVESPFPIMIHAEDGEVIQISKTWTELTGYKPEEIKTVPDWTEKAYGKKMEVVQADIDETFRIGKRVYWGEYGITTCDGRTITWDFSSAPLGKLPDGRRLVISMAADITERKKAEEEIKQAKECYDRLTDNAGEAIFRVNTKDKGGGVFYANSAAERIFGYSLEEWLSNKSLGFEIIHPDYRDKQKQINEEIVAKKETMKNVVLGWIAKDGHEVIMEYTIIPIVGKDGEIASFESIGRDITERKKAEQQLEIAKEQAEAANMAKSQFLANMSHEIRTPMNAIIGFGDLLAAEELTKDQLTYAELIRNSGKSLLILINDILDYSKIEAGKLEVESVEYSLKKIIDDIDSMMRPLAVEKNLPFEIICSEGLPTIIQTDNNRLHQCLVNLVSNAIKFTDQGHVHFKVSIEDKDAKPFIRFDVEDTGIGISLNMQEHIFESFGQVEKGSTRKYGGTGLGLTITSQLAGLLGGEVSFTSHLGKGSTFSLLIPAGVDVTSRPLLEKAVRETIPTKEAVHTYSGKVLVAEDDEGCRVLTCRLLERMRLEVTTANNGKEAIEKTLNGPFDLIFMDVRMPYLDGFQATEALHQKGITTPIIALTAYAMEGDRELCIQAGCNDYLSKPIDREKLYKILDKYLPAKPVQV